MDNIQILQEALALPSTELPHLKALRAIVYNHVPHDLEFLAQQALLPIIQEYNDLVRANGLGESCVVKPTDTTKTIRKRCKKAFRHGLKHYPMRYVYAVANSPLASGLSEENNPYDAPDASINTFTGQLKRDTRKIKKPLTLKLVDPESGLQRDDDEYKIVEADSSTERVRRYYKRHPKKVKQYLRKTSKDRSQRNRDRAKAVEKYGEQKMKNHDVHHPNGVGEPWRLAKKDHGRDKKDGKSPETSTTSKKTSSKKPSLKKNIALFITYASKELKLSQEPKIKIVEPSKDMSSLGGYSPETKEIHVVVKGRLLADILRTIAHEMVHQLQHETGMELDGSTGSPIENSANAMAGILLRNYGKMNKKIFISENVLLTEGGAAGHLAHPFEDPDLTFGDMKEMIDRGLVGGLDQEGPVTEKLDGQNIAFSVRDGQVVFARNKGQVKNRGRNALDVAGIRQMFAGRGNIEKAFGSAAEDLQAAISRLSPEQQQEMFGNGSRFMSAEVILPDTQNVIPYGKSILVMHGTIEYDDSGEEIGRQPDAGQTLADAVTAVGAEKQKTYGIEGPRTIAFSENEAEKYKQRAEQYKATLDRVAAEYDLDEDATLAEYRKKWWENKLIQISQETGIEFTKKEFDGLLSRWVDGQKTFGVKDIEDPEKKKWFREFEKNELQAAQKEMIRPVETTFLRVGADAMRRTTNTLGANNPEAAARLRQDVLTAIKAIQGSNDPDQIANLQREMERLQAIGMDQIVPSEGVVFMYNGKPYKFTGTFAPVNRILATLKFGKPPKQEPKKDKPIEAPKVTQPKAEQPPKPTEPQKPRRTVAIFSGRFQPFHAGHYSIYKSLVERFGKENVYIASSDVTDAVRSPFGFGEKKDIITKMFGVPEDMIVQVKNPYAPKEILDKLPDDTTYVTAVSQKDADRLSGKYFTPFEDTPEGEHTGFKDGGYYIVAPEMQMDVDGRNISGTAFRAAMGNPKYTERAKKELFTKVYGKFDQKIFDKIVKVTTASEEARALTDRYGKQDDKKKGERKGKKAGDSKPTSTKTRSPEEEERHADVSAARSILTQKIVNKKTGREILVATALKYPEDQPVRKAAERLVQQAIAKARSARRSKGGKKNEQIMLEHVEEKKLTLYNNVREFTDEELDAEVGEYFENEKTKEAFPDLATTPGQLKDAINGASETVLTREELIGMFNSDVGDVLTSNKPKELMVKIAKENERDLQSLKAALKEEDKLPMPIIIKYPDGYYLMGGNTRLCILAAYGMTMPVKILNYNKTPLLPASHGAALDTPAKSKGKNLFKKILSMKITNPETGNLIKIDTAMDYNKRHPAHKVALNTIRQHMRGLSNRAGIPKNRTK